MSAPIQIVRAQRIVDNVYEGLHEAILSGQLLPGEKLSVPALAQQLSVSRSPVREAVARLTTEGLAVESPRRGAVVAKIGLADLAELYEVREALEGVVTRLAVERSGRHVVDDLEPVIERHAEAIARGDMQAHVECDMEFHAVIRRGSSHDLAIRLLDQIQSRVKLAMRSTSVTAGPERALEDHKRILAALRLGDARESEARAREHVARLRGVLRDSVRP